MFRLARLVLSVGLSLVLSLGLLSCAASSGAKGPTVPAQFPLPHPYVMEPIHFSALIRLEATGASNFGLSNHDWLHPVFGAWVDRVNEDGTRTFVGLATYRAGQLSLPAIPAGAYEIEPYSGWASHHFEAEELATVIACLSDTPPTDPRSYGRIPFGPFFHGETHGVKLPCQVLPNGQTIPTHLNFNVQKL